ncbi:MAG: hypothetical protein MUC39_00745 [Candidatus Omnitrophica bacterium]|jgi:hypothetical protein|nr:hypothetical protein [Candidatus Omnitrophota bacterium]
MEKDRSSQRLVGKANLLGQILIKNGLINQEQLDKALNIQKTKGGMLGDVLTQLGFISQEALSMTLASQMEAVYLPIEKYKVSKDALNAIPKELALKYQCLPLEKLGGILAVVMVNPLDQDAIDEIERLTQHKLVCMIGTKIQIESALKENY